MSETFFPSDAARIEDMQRQIDDIRQRLVAPSEAVVAETAFGLTAKTGASGAFSRGDHTHGSPAAPAAPPSASGSVISETAYGLAASAGASGAFSRGDHTHGSPTDLRPAGAYWRTAVQSIPNATDQPVFGTTSLVQSGVTWDGSGGLQVPTAGWYLLTATVKWATNATGQRSLHIYGPQVLADVHVLAGAGMSGPGQNASVIAKLAAGSTWGMSVLQQSGAALDIEAVASYSPYFSVHWLGA